MCSSQLDHTAVILWVVRVHFIIHTLHVTYRDHLSALFPPLSTATKPPSHHTYPAHMPAKTRKRTASNVDEVASIKRPRNARQPDPNNDDVAIEEDPEVLQGVSERKTRAKGKRGAQKGKESRQVVVNPKGKAAR
jgi:hypothetical protein